MPFPSTDHTIFEKNTLTGVTCQLNYPPILKIDQETPFAFQEAVRGEYPLFQKRPTIQMTMAPLGGQPVAPSVANSYVFSTPELPQPQRTLALGQDSLALTTTVYTRRSDFVAQLQPPLESLQAIYKPAFFTRVGLRYQNLIVRSLLGLGQTPWSELLKPRFVGLASVDELIGRVSIDYSQVQFKGKSGNVVVQHGITVAVTGTEQEQCYLIDVDVSTDERVNLQDVTEKIRALNIDALEFYHWCLTDNLKTALVPRHIG